jgi:hypothetical protein
VPTLNRFPLLGLWAEEAARRLGYRRDEAESLGHAYAVLYAIRANRVARTSPTAKEEAHHAAKRPKVAVHDQVDFGGDQLDVCRVDGQLRGAVGGGPQSPGSYRTSVAAKFPSGYYEQLQRAFRRFFKTLPPNMLRGGLLYNLYDEWKKSCGVGRLVDLDRLLAWCREHADGATGNRG